MRTLWKNREQHYPWVWVGLTILGALFLLTPWTWPTVVWVAVSAAITVFLLVVSWMVLLFTILDKKDVDKRG